MIAKRAATIAKRGDDCKRWIDARTRTVRSGMRFDNPGYLVSFPDYRPQLVRESGHGNETGIKHLMMESEDFEAVLSAMEQAIVRLGARFPISVGEQNEVLRRSVDVVVETALAIEPYLLDGQSLVSQCIQVCDAVSVLHETQQEQVVCRDRPRISITEEQLRYFVEHAFKVCDIAYLFGCSKRTVERRLQEYGIVRECRYSNISDDHLSEVIGSILLCKPNIGERSVDGILRSRGMCVQRARVRETMHAVDYDAIRSRLCRALHRREYHVESPNALWHVDSYHKLIRWRIVVHGGIDGYSRVVPYSKAAPDNRSNTAYNAFIEGTERYGLPSRVRSDHGGENVMIAEYMIRQRGTGRRTMITGRSVHNQRIERLWRNVFSGCVSYFYFLFRTMEAEQQLNSDSIVDLLALHYIFLPRVQAQLDSFREGWCQHRLRTEHNYTTHQLWTMGMEDAQRRGEEVDRAEEVRPI